MSIRHQTRNFGYDLAMPFDILFVISLTGIFIKKYSQKMRYRVYLIAVKYKVCWPDTKRWTFYYKLTNKLFRRKQNIILEFDRSSAPEKSSNSEPVVFNHLFISQKGEFWTIKWIKSFLVDNHLNPFLEKWPQISLLLGVLLLMLALI